MSQRTERGTIWGRDQGVTEHTNDNQVESAEAYAAPAIERREEVSGLLGASKGSYCPPTTVNYFRHR